MLRPLAIQASLEALISPEEVPADVALIVLSESGSIYAQAHTNKGRNDAKRDSTKPLLGDIDRLQRRNQPGLASLMPLNAGLSSAPSSARLGSAMSISLTQDERARVLAGIAAQAWTEELARVRRIQIGVSGRFGTSGVVPSSGPSLLSGASGSGSGFRPTALTKLSNVHETPSRSSPKVGSHANSDDEGDDEDSIQEGITLPVATPGTTLASESGSAVVDVAPLLLEGELGATLVMPLRPQNQPQSSSTQSPATLHEHAHAPLLLVLSSRTPHPESEQVDDIANATPVQGTSSLSHDQWNALNDCAQSFAQHIAPSLRKAFGRGGELLADDGHGIVHAGGATTIFSDDRESLASVEASHLLNNASGNAHDAATNASGISVS